MHGDFSIAPEGLSKPYTDVLEQQGRVRLDRDFNEHVSIQQRLRRTALKDIVGQTGVPLDKPGFAISGISNGEAVDFEISVGRMYVDGILCELSESTMYSSQDAHPRAPAIDPVADGRTDLVYLDVWQRHITVIEDPELRDVALGGPDTTTRLLTICQVKVKTVDNIEHARCDDVWPQDTNAPSGAMLSTALEDPDDPEDPCIVAPGGGYRGLENRLYRVEVHAPGDMDAATIVWSRDDGAIAYPIASFGEPDEADEIKTVDVTQLGRDQVMALQIGDWVEVLGDETELSGEAGTLTQVEKISDSTVTLTSDVSAHKDEAHGKLRRWDGAAEGGIAVSVGTIDLEDGISVELELEDGEFKVGDYWAFKARTATREIDELIKAPPLGITHHYAKLAVIKWVEDEGELVPEICDCRSKFPSLVGQRNLLYAGGDGQEMMPPNVSGAAQWLCSALSVRAVNAGEPIEGERVRFQIQSPSGGALRPIGDPGDGESPAIEIETDEHGIAQCQWQLNSTDVCQSVSAWFLDCDDEAKEPAIDFSARLSIASEVANQTNCPMLADEATVQDALDRLCANSALYYVSGDGQEAPAGEELCGALEVRLANGRFPIPGATVIFEILPDAGGGPCDGVLTEIPPVPGPAETGTLITTETNEFGLASCTWRLDTDPTKTCQRVVAFSAEAPELVIHFNARPEVAADDPGVVISRVLQGRSLFGTEALLNDAPITVEDLLAGITMVCSERVDPDTISRATCYVSVEVPYLENGEWISGSYVRIIVPASPTSVTETDPNVGETRHGILWRPNAKVQEWFEQKFEFVSVQLGRLVVHGNFIWAPTEQTKGALHYLDGDSFGMPGGDGRTAVVLDPSSGDGRSGGDFAMWFWLRQQGQGSVVFDPSDILDFGNVTIGVVKELPITIINESQNTYKGAVEISGDVFSTQAPVFELAPGAVLSLGVVFAPGSISQFEETLTVTLTGAEPITNKISLTGSGVVRQIILDPNGPIGRGGGTIVNPGDRTPGEISGIGEVSVARLASGGITNLNQLASARPADVAAILEISEERAKQFITQAKKLSRQ